MKKFKLLIVLQLVIILYSVSSVIAKMASRQELFSREFFFWYGLEILCLGVYAIFWQQMIKRIELSMAYANRAMVLFWSLLWSAFLFKEGITVQNIAGVILVIAGILVINFGERKNA